MLESKCKRLESKCWHIVTLALARCHLLKSAWVTLIRWNLSQVNHAFLLPDCWRGCGKCGSAKRRLETRKGGVIYDGYGV